ncbi:MAG: hypothetical protein JEZ00_07940 [Anaerolineaceae bacterium]|nr:hypothetical protein [Anaerolineaceae bacterium]
MKPINVPKIRCLISRFLIGLVLVSNLESAFAFFLKPELFNSAYELSGIPGQAAIRGFAILFFMWNIPYVFALIHPLKNHLSLIEAILMQFVGLIGESWLITQIPLQHSLLRSSIYRFIIFDGAGLLLLFLAAGVIVPLTKRFRPANSGSIES